MFQTTQLVSSRARLQTRWYYFQGPALNYHPRLSLCEFLREGSGTLHIQAGRDDLDWRAELPSWSVHLLATETNLVYKVLKVQVGGIRDRERPWRG